ncbi:MAG: Hsp70 family protein, partial [Candidatus Thermoplasmatota archaeon]
MQCVALGAAIQGAILSGEVTDILLLDVTPLSLGVETLGGVFTRLIDRNTTIPTRKSQVFSTAADGQTTVEVHVLQGERPMAADDVSLGKFYLTGIPPAPRGMPQIEVTFDIDANGILTATALDKGTGKSEKLTILAPHRMEKDAIDRAVKDAEKHADDDRRRRELADLKNESDALLYSTEKMLKELGDKVSEGTRKGVEAKMEELREALKTDDVQRLRKAFNDLKQESQKVGIEIYQRGQAATPPPAGEAPQEPPSGGDDKVVVDVDFDDVKKD